MRRIASSALAVAVVGAILAAVSGYAAQRVAREWQQEDKRLEVRTALVRRVSETSADFIGVVRLRGLGAVDDSGFDSAFRKWSIASSSIGGELQAHVDSEEVQTRWRNYRTNMAHVYYFFRTLAPRQRRHWLKKIAAYWGPENPDGAFLVLEGLVESPASAPGRPAFVYAESLRELLDRLQLRSEAVAAQILEASTNT
jgi:hypothetical protein